MKELDERLLLDYLKGVMPHDQQHQLEELLDADPFLSDALDGLADINDKEKLKIITGQINRQLHHNIKQRKSERRKRKKLNNQWGWIFVLILIILILISWLGVRTMIN